jgi:hypothetical protein
VRGPGETVGKETVEVSNLCRLRSDGYWPIANLVLFAIAWVLIIIGIVILGVEYHWWSRMRIFKAYGIPP